MDQFPFPNGGQNKLAVLHLDNLTDELLKGAFTFISRHGFHFTPNNKTKHIVVPRGCMYSGKRTQSIEFESLFKQALDDGSDNMKHRDYYRYQTSPDCAQKLMECPEIKLIVNKVQACINHQVRGYVANKISVLYSLPGGKAQGWHEDDSRPEGEIVKSGMLLSVIVALQPDTKLDVWNGSFERKTFVIPKGTMFVFGGKLVHSGSAYATHNLRLHIYFTKSCDIVGDTDNREVFDNSIAHTYFCPVEDCPKHIQRCNLTASQMRNHWRMKHAPVEKMGWKRYEAGKVGKLHKCTQCVQTFLNVDGLRKHVSLEHQPSCEQLKSSNRKRKNRT